MAGIFISYRRDDSAGYAGRLYDRLSDHFGPDQVFMDVDTIKPGQNFVDAVRQAVGGCDGLVAIIGREWLTISDAEGVRRLDDPQDIVSLEIATALERGIRVIPVLVQGAPMPATTDFPESLKELAYRNAQEIGDRSFNSDAQSLIEALEAPELELPETDDFVGRQREMAELRAALDAAMAGRGQMVMLSGEPGIGKTRLAQELASRAESLGAQVMWGWCYEHAGAPPYWPYVQPIRTYAETTDLATLISQIGLVGPAIAEIIPELRAKLPGLGQPIAAEPEQARFRLFDSVSTFLKNLAQSKPLLFILDDLHWADSSSLLMLEFLVREIADSPVLVLGTYRDVEITAGHPMSRTLGNLVRERHFRRVQLDGLTQQEVGEFVEGNKGVNLPSEILETIHSRTDGNPLFVNEVVGLINPEQMTESRAWADIIPEGVRDAIGSRLSRLSPTCNQVLGTASVVGREFGLSLLTSLDSDIGADEVLEALDEALKTKVIEELPGSVGRYQFGHALIQQSLYGELSTVRRLRAHTSIGEALERTHGSNLAEHAAELARHFAEAESVLGPEKLVHYSLMAGQRALRAFAYEDALTHFQTGLVARDISLSGMESATDDEAAALLFGQGKVQATLQIYEAFSSLGRAFDHSMELGDLERVVAIAEYGDYGTGVRRSDLLEFARRALTLVPPDSHFAGRLLCRYGQLVGLQGSDYEDVHSALERALEIAKREGDAALEMRTYAVSATVDVNHTRVESGLRNSLNSIRLSDQVDDVRSLIAARYCATTCSLVGGNLGEARIHARAMLEPVDRLQDPFWLASACWKNAGVERIAGEWEKARDFCVRGLAIGTREHAVLSELVLIEHELGNTEQGNHHLERLLKIVVEGATFGYGASLPPIVMNITGSLDWLDTVKSAAEIHSRDTAAWPITTDRVQFGMALVAVLEGDVVAARDHYGFFEGRQGTMNYWWEYSADRLLGLLARTMESRDQAVIHFEDALAFSRKAGFLPELAWTCCDYADMLLQRSGEGDGAKATSLLEESLAISSELGMRPLMERVQVRQKGL